MSGPTIAPNPVDAALVAVLAADTDPDVGFVALVPGGIHHLVAPENPGDPYCVFGVTQPSADTYTMSGLAYSSLIYGLDVIQAGLSAERAQSAAARLFSVLNDGEAALNDELTGWVVMACRRTGYAERLERTEGGLIYQHVQSLFGLIVRPA